MAAGDHDFGRDVDTARDGPTPQHVEQSFYCAQAHGRRIVDGRLRDAMTDRELVGQIEVASGMGRDLAALPGRKIGPQRTDGLQAGVAPHAVDRLFPGGEFRCNDLAADLLLPAGPADVGDTQAWVAGENRPCTLQPPLRRFGLKQPREENNGATPAKALRHP